MSQLNIPTAEQFENTITQLGNIAAALGTQIDTSTWAGVQKAVQAGVAPRLFPIGTQLSVNHSVYGTHLYDVVAHDYFKSAKDGNAHTMTLLSHDIFPSMQIDNREAFYYADTELPVGTYNFTLTGGYNSWVAGTYQFTLTQVLPKGGHLVINGTPSSDITTLTVNAYASATTSTVTESVAISAGDDGTSLGTFGTELNSIGRCAYGSSNYKESAIRQFLNSSSAAGSVWTPQTKFDRPPSWMSSTAGFMAGLDEDFLAIIGEVIVPCSSNNIYESPDSMVTVGSTYTVNDKFYSASLKEITGLLTNSIDDGSEILPFYEGTTEVDRIKYRDEAALNWRLRTPTKDGVNSIYCILSDGTISPSGAGDAFGFVPMCTIV